MKKIILIDDEEDFGFFVKKNLEERGDFTVEVCNDSTTAFEKVKQLKPDLILLDILMPVKSGPDIADEIRNDKDTRNIPFIFLTAVVQRGETLKNNNVIGGEYFIAKPVKMEELLNIINQVAS
jgi:CheY-like chemotaxis protein